MSRPQSAAVLAAIADIQAGMKWRAAAAKHGINQSSIKRALDRIASLCPCCGQPTNRRICLSPGNERMNHVND